MASKAKGRGRGEAALLITLAVVILATALTTGRPALIIVGAAILVIELTALLEGGFGAAMIRVAGWLVLVVAMGLMGLIGWWWWVPALPLAAALIYGAIVGLQLRRW